MVGNFWTQTNQETGTVSIKVLNETSQNVQRSEVFGFLWKEFAALRGRIYRTLLKKVKMSKRAHFDKDSERFTSYTQESGQTRLIYVGHGGKKLMHGGEKGDAWWPIFGPKRIRKQKRHP